MNFTPGTSLSVAAFLVIVVGVIVAFLAGAHRSTADRRLAARRLTLAVVALALWLGGIAVVVASGALAARPTPRVMVLFGVINLVSIGAALSPVGGWFAAGISLRALVFFQAFRLPLELVLHDWVASGTIPAAMTWTGSNWDIGSGIVALLCGSWADRSRTAAWIANLIGAALLLNVVRVAICSSPLPFAWPVQPPLQLVFHLPYALIAPVCVGGALFGHVVLTRALLRKS